MFMMIWRAGFNSFWLQSPWKPNGMVEIYWCLENCNVNYNLWPEGSRCLGCLVVNAAVYLHWRPWFSQECFPRKWNDFWKQCYLNYSVNNELGTDHEQWWLTLESWVKLVLRLVTIETKCHISDKWIVNVNFNFWPSDDKGLSGTRYLLVVSYGVMGSAVFRTMILLATLWMLPSVYLSPLVLYSSQSQ